MLLVALACIEKILPSGIKKVKPKLPMFGYDLFYADKKAGDAKPGVIYSQVLYSEKYGLSGKPDLVFMKKGGRELLPVELKSASIGDAPEPRVGDLMQLSSYFIILDENYGIRVKEGRLIYSDFMFRVRNTKRLRRQLLSIVDEMRDMLKTGVGRGEQPAFQKCRHCVCRGTVCDRE